MIYLSIGCERKRGLVSGGDGAHGVVGQPDDELGHGVVVLYQKKKKKKKTLSQASGCYH